MPKTDLSNLLGRAGNQRTRSEVLQVMSFPGLSVDNTASVPEIAGGFPGGGNSVNQQVANLSQQLGDLKTAQQSQLDKLNENTQAVVQNTASRSGSSSGGGSSLAGIASSILSSTGLSPIITSLIGLFGSSTSQQTVQTLTPFALPPAIQFAGGVQSNGSVTPVDYGQSGQLRTLGGNTAQPAQTNVQVHVNALDSQSFLDHSEDIAQAVRHALLNSSTLNDVIAEL